MSETMHQLITSFEDVDFIYSHKVGDKEFLVDTREFKKILGGVSYKENAVSVWIFEFLTEGERELYN